MLEGKICGIEMEQEIKGEEKKHLFNNRDLNFLV